MIELVEVIDPQILKMAFALEQIVTDQKQSVADGYNRSLASSVSGDSLEESGEVAVFGPGGAVLRKNLAQDADCMSSSCKTPLFFPFLIRGLAYRCRLCEADLLCSCPAW